MGTQTDKVQEVKTHLSRLLEEVASGAEVIIIKAGEPMARIPRIEESTPKIRFGVLFGKVKVAEDFEVPLPDDLLLDFESAGFRPPVTGMMGMFICCHRPYFVIGLMPAGLSFLIGAQYVFQKPAGVNLTPSLPATVFIVTFFSGIHLFGLGLLGEYVGRIYDDVKRRPMYIVDKAINFSKKDSS